MAAFHPELTGDRRLHQMFVEMTERGEAKAMSGHSKWATTKHHKGAKDAARAKVFAKLIRQIEVAAREGGSDMTANATLRTMFTKARDSSVPIDTIERAIKRGTGELEGVRYESISYEGYAPDGVAIIVECLSDNRNRTGAEIRNLFAKNGGAMAEPGAVAGSSSARAWSWCPAPTTRSGSSRWPSRPAPRTWSTRTSVGWSRPTRRT